MEKFSTAHCLIAAFFFGFNAAAGAAPDLDEAEHLLRRGAFKQVSEALRKASSNSPETRQRALILEAEAALALGQPSRAAGQFEQAASQFRESPEAEVGQIRAYFQEGDVRHAIAFGNIVAAEHPDFTEALALLAWFEDRVGHTDHALAKLRDARSKTPDDVALLGGMAEILIDRGMASEAIQALDTWMARNPAKGVIHRLRAKAALASGDWDDALRWRSRSAHAYESEGDLAQAKTLRDWLASADPLGQASRSIETLPVRTKPDSMPPAPASTWHSPRMETISLPKGMAVSTGNGFIVDNGRRVITHARVVAKTTGDVVVRNGLGQVRKARVERRYDKEGLALLRLAQAYPADWSLKPEGMAAPDGIKFCFVLGYSVADTLDSASPVIAPGLVFRADTGVAGLMQITSALSRGHSGSPVFDTQGHLIGIALGKEDEIKGVADRQAFLGKGDIAIRADVLQRLFAFGGKPSRKQAPKPALPESLSVETLYDRLRPAVVLIAAPVAPD
jgi:tetratricopeptide (TPR) repeat protein